MRLIFFGDGDWAADSLRRIAARPWQVAAVVLRFQSSNDSLGAAARDLGLPILQPRHANSPEFLAIVKSLAPDINASVSYDQIVRKPLLESAPMGFVNFHAGKLPRYRGRNVINWAIINGDAEIGITGHFMDEGIDTGDILLQRSVPISWTDTYGDVLHRVVAAFPDLVEETLASVAEGRGRRSPQDHAQGTYFGGRGPGDEWLDWSDSSRNLHNKVRAITHPGPGARSVLDGRSVVIWKAFYDPDWPRYVATPGQVVGKDPEGALIKTGDSVLLVKEAQGEGEASQRPSWRIGTRLGRDVTGVLQSTDNRVQAGGVEPGKERSHDRR